MNVLYYSWKSACDGDCIAGLKNIGMQVHVFSEKFDKYDEDESFLVKAITFAREIEADAIFSFNYFPDLSRLAAMLNIPYISWVYDSPHLTLESLTLNSPNNNVFLFDYALAQKYLEEGNESVFYMPLATNVSRHEKDLGIENFDRINPATFGPKEYDHDITFLGRMYDDDQNFFAQINYLPERLKGIIDAAINAQKGVYGIDFAQKILTPQILSEVKKYVKAELGPLYRNCSDEIIRNMVRKQITVDERRELLTLIGEHFGDSYRVDHYAPAKSDLPVNYKGYAGYNTQMPEIFYKSRINLNISLRSIQTGIPLRVIDILGAGGFCLTNYQAELSQYFENGVDLVWFESPDDMLEKIAYYLEHEEQRRAIARNGHEKAREIFSYEKQLSDIFGI